MERLATRSLPTVTVRIGKRVGGDVLQRFSVTALDLGIIHGVAETSKTMRDVLRMVPWNFQKDHRLDLCQQPFSGPQSQKLGTFHVKFDKPGSRISRQQPVKRHRGDELCLTYPHPPWVTARRWQDGSTPGLASQC